MRFFSSHAFQIQRHIDRRITSSRVHSTAYNLNFSFQQIWLPELLNDAFAQHGDDWRCVTDGIEEKGVKSTFERDIHFKGRYSEFSPN